MAIFVWTGAGNYPAGGFPWNAQPLAAAPAQTYFTPSPAGNPLKINAENWNYILAQIAGNLSDQQAETGAHKLVSVTQLASSDFNLGTPPVVASVLTSDLTLHTLTGAGGPSGITLPFQVSGIQSGDRIEIDVASSGSISSGASPTYEVYLSQSIIASGPPSYATIPSTGTWINFAIPAPVPFAMKALLTSGVTGTLDLIFQARCSTSSASSFALVGNLAMVAKVWRPTGVPQ